MLEVKIAGFDASITLSSRGSFSNNNSSPCKVNLSVGKWQQATAGFIPIKVKVPAGSSFRFRWEFSDIQPLGFSTPGALLSLFEFGNSRMQSFHATEVRIAPALPVGASVELGLVAQSEQKEVPLTVSSFLVGTDQLQFGASGRGRVLEDAKIITTANMIDAINRYPLIAALFAAANLGLLNWAKRKFFPPRGVGSKSVIQFPKETPPEDGSHETDGKKAG